ncbi:MAG: ATP-binding cassette domain-containing protein, partial [Terricaulis sp.]
MPATITLSNLSWATPGGRELFSDLDFTFGAERAGLVGRNGVGKTTLLKMVAGELAPRTGAVAMNGRVAVLRQMVQVHPDQTVADLFEIRDALKVLTRAERGEASADDVAHADWTLEARLAKALARFMFRADAALQ